MLKPYFQLVESDRTYNGWGLVEGDSMSGGTPMKEIVEVQSLLPCLLHFLFTMMCVALHTECCPL